MEWIVVLILTYGAHVEMVISPFVYSTETRCEAAGLDWVNPNGGVPLSNRQFECLPVR